MKPKRSKLETVRAKQMAAPFYRFMNGILQPAITKNLPLKKHTAGRSTARQALGIAAADNNPVYKKG